MNDDEFDLMDMVEKILKKEGIEFQWIWDDYCSDGWRYTQCNLRFSPKKEKQQ